MELILQKQKKHFPHICIVMALEIRTAPVLSGKDAEYFLESIQKSKNSIQKDELAVLVENTKKIWAEFHANKK